jgi:hypothetical protein
MGSISEYQEYTQPPAIIAMIVSLPLLVTVVMFPSMIRHKVFMEIIVSLIVCDILGNWPYAIGYYPNSGTALCSFAAFCNLFFLRATWLYTLAMVFNLRCLVFHRRALLVKYWLHGFALVVPLVLSLAQLSTNPYGKPSKGMTVCSIKGNDLDAKYWHDIAYSGLLLICLLVMIIMVLRLKYLEWIGSPLVAKDTYKMTLRYVKIYPVLLALCWLPHTILDYVHLSSHSPTVEYLGPVFDILKILHGATIAVGFYVTSREARQRWKRLLCKSVTPITAGTVGLDEDGINRILLQSKSSELVIEDFVSDHDIQTILRAQSTRETINSSSYNANVNADFNGYSDSKTNEL